MNSGNSKPSFFDKFRDNLPAVLYTKVPLPSFLENTINFPNLPALLQKSLASRGATKARTAPNANTSSGTPKKHCLQGELKHGASTQYAVNNIDLEIDSSTWIIGDLEYGKKVRVKGKYEGKKFIATQVIFLNR